MDDVLAYCRSRMSSLRLSSYQLSTPAVSSPSICGTGSLRPYRAAAKVVMSWRRLL
ncbi:hypothetical protein KCP76_06040 [Salmonella enterica subsp. enterica serovar Weltevreden]|nr:hypothetical protein KCP76_06040 [Salmonella enterica subsp. enterica serovar Weltevreden]